MHALILHRFLVDLVQQTQNLLNLSRECFLALSIVTIAVNVFLVFEFCDSGLFQGLSELIKFSYTTQFDVVLIVD